MLTRHVIAFVAVAFAMLSGVTLAIGGFSALAHDRHDCATPTADSPFMGMSDPDAPYDLRFIDEMVMHHRGAIMSAEMMISDSEHSELRDLAQRIQEEQQQQIDQMLAWRAELYPDAATPIGMEPGDDAMGGMMDGGMMDGGMMDGSGMMDMMMGGMMDGEMTDRMFLRMMIPHHQLAIDMAEDALAHAKHEELKALAQEIIDGQSAEITEMEGYLRDWYDEASTRDAASEMRAMMQQMMGGC